MFATDHTRPALSYSRMPECSATTTAPVKKSDNQKASDNFFEFSNIQHCVAGTNNVIFKFKANNLIIFKNNGGQTNNIVKRFIVSCRFHGLQKPHLQVGILAAMR